MILPTTLWGGKSPKIFPFLCAFFGIAVKCGVKKKKGKSIALRKEVRKRPFDCYLGRVGERGLGGWRSLPPCWWGCQFLQYLLPTSPSACFGAGTLQQTPSPPLRLAKGSLLPPRRRGPGPRPCLRAGPRGPPTPARSTSSTTTRSPARGRTPGRRSPRPGDNRRATGPRRRAGTGRTRAGPRRRCAVCATRPPLWGCPSPKGALLPDFSGGACMEQLHFQCNCRRQPPNHGGV